VQGPTKDVVDSVTTVEDFDSAGAEEIGYVRRIEPTMLKWNQKLWKTSLPLR
jgi:hypothetical protein